MSCRIRFFLALVAAAATLTGCMNPLYLFVPARKLFVAVPATRKIFELDRAGLRGTGRNITLDGGGTRLVYSPARRTLFAIMPEARNLAEISPDSYQVIQHFSTQGRPSDLAISRDGKFAYVLNPEDRAVVRIDLATRKPQTIPYSDADLVPAAIATHPAKEDDLYVVSAGGAVSVAVGGNKGAGSLVLAGASGAGRIVPGRRGDLLVVDTVGTNLFRITEPDSAKVETYTVGLQGGSAAVGKDGTIYVTAPAAGKLVVLTPDQRREEYDVKTQAPRAIAADGEGVYIATEGTNQVLAMVLTNGRLNNPQVIDTLPGPPVDMAVVD